MSTLLEARIEQITATAQRSNEKLGFAPAGRPPERIFVKKVEANSWAASYVCVGDEMVAVEGQAASKMTVKELARHMTSVRPLTIVFGLRTKAAAIRIQSAWRGYVVRKRRRKGLAIPAAKAAGKSKLSPRPSPRSKLSSSTIENGASSTKEQTPKSPQKKATPKAKMDAAGHKADSTEAAKQLKLVREQLETCEQEKRELRLELDKVRAAHDFERSLRDAHAKELEALESKLLQIASETTAEEVGQILLEVRAQKDVSSIASAQASLDAQRVSLLGLRDDVTSLMKELQRRLREAEDKIRQLAEENVQLRSSVEGGKSSGNASNTKLVGEHELGTRFASLVQDCEATLSLQSGSLESMVSSKTEGVDLVPMWSTLFKIGSGKRSIDDEKLVIESYLCKRGPTYGYDWTKVWTVLLRDCVLCFTDSTCREKKSEVKITPGTRALSFQASEAPGDSPKHRNEKEFGFVLEEGKSKRLFYFDVGSRAQLEAWLKAVDVTTQDVTKKAAIRDSILNRVEEWEKKAGFGSDTDRFRRASTANKAAKHRASVLPKASIAPAKAHGPA